MIKIEILEKDSKQRIQVSQYDNNGEKKVAKISYLLPMDGIKYPKNNKALKSKIKELEDANTETRGELVYMMRIANEVLELLKGYN